MRSRDTCGSCTVSRARETCGLLSFPLVPLVESTASWVQETCSLPSFASSFWLLLHLCFHARCYSPSFLSIPDVVGLDMILSHGARFSLDDNRSVILNLSRLWAVRRMSGGSAPGWAADPFRHPPNAHFHKIHESGIFVTHHENMTFTYIFSWAIKLILTISRIG